MSRLSIKAAQSQEDVEEEDVSQAEGDSYHESDVEISVESEAEQDETEEELEHLVFGDRAGFRERLKSFPNKDVSEDATGLEGLDDAEVG